MVTREDGWHYPLFLVKGCIMHPPVVDCLNLMLNDIAFSKCSDICTLHMCKLCLNSSDEFQFQAFPHSSARTRPN